MSEPVEDAQRPMPLHRRIAESITRQITAGALKPGQRLPSERQIAEDFGASRATVRTALHHLEQSGVINRRERRSAIVALRRESSPSIRIACGSSRILHLLRRLGEYQVLPARFQLQLVDLSLPGTLEYALTHPGDAGDVLFCDFDYLPCLSGREAYYHLLNHHEFADLKISDILGPAHISERDYRAVPVSLAPLTLFADRRYVDPTAQPNVSQGQSGTWLSGLPEWASRDGAFCLQLRPVLSHLSLWFSWFGIDLFSPDPHHDGGLREGLQLLHDWLHRQRQIPVLARAEQINLFEQGRCGLTVDGYDAQLAYRRQLGDALSLMPLPAGSQPPLTGIMAIALRGANDETAAVDLLRNLLGAPIQKMICQLGGGLPARRDMLNHDELVEAGVPASDVDALLEQLQDCSIPRYPADPQKRAELETLFLEFWLGLESVEQTHIRLTALLNSPDD